MASLDTHLYETKANLITTLEGILVEEFRTCQSLQKVVKQERYLLIEADVNSLSDLIEEKDILLDELSQIEEQRRMTIEKLTEHYPLVKELTTAEDLFELLDPVVSKRLERLYTGIRTLIDQIKEFNLGNQALALNGLSRVDAVQAYLLNIFQNPQDYQPPGSTSQQSEVLVYDLDQRT